MKGLALAGYAALFDRRDAGGDSIRRGAFARSLAARTGPLPLLWQHREGVRIGEVLSASEYARGLRVVATLDQPEGVAARALRRGAITGLSFGYRVRSSRPGPRAGQRELLDVEIVEVSLVTHPMQHGARVHLVT